MPVVIKMWKEEQEKLVKILHSLDIIFAPRHTAFAFLAMYVR